MKNLNKCSILERLIYRGDFISIEDGYLNIRPISGSSVPLYWLNENRATLMKDIVNLFKVDAFCYQNYTTGRYQIKNNSSMRTQGITLQFESLLSASKKYAIFNVELTRDRNTKYGKAGDDLPKGQFRVRKAHGFYRFWLSTRVKLPVRLSAFHDCMGKLKNIIFTGEVNHKGKLDNKTLAVLNVSYESIKQALGECSPDIKQTISRQVHDNFQTIIPDKESSLELVNKGSDVNTTTGIDKCELSLQDDVLTSNPLPYHLALKKELTTMSSEEWLKGLD